MNQNANSYKPPYWQYQGTELHRDTGVPGSRFLAFDLPSRVGAKLHYPDGRVLAFPYASAESSKLLQLLPLANAGARVSVG